ncbi:SMI1/KNR4 family protein, partial [Vibrio parahaemolyticus]
ALCIRGFMEFIDRPVGANQEEIYKLETIFQITLPESMLNWWSVSDGPIVYFGFKELQFFSLSEIYGEDIYGVKHDMSGAMPICLDGNGNICVARIEGGVISGFYVVDSSDLGWEQAKIISCEFLKFVNDSFSPEERLNA